ncbi:hypothetical protein [Actinoallomurus soli]|uniref:hypothetical protein n=1 Tax=Actinoallomurus soli TaxID=2952535 RepID=UPI0020921857|nr:hypothetical protein [Actinoallomurus soli]MCO5970224.1 hypothetical protein [Actinoallomurus soli]
MALRKAQAEAFRKGEYYWAYDGRGGFPERRRPKSVDQLWEDPVIQELMTHSVLDMNGVSPAGEEPDILQAAPLSPEVTREVFGSERPTRADYDRAADAKWDVIEDRGYGCYVVLYREDMPDEIAFFGVTGD